MYNKANFNKGIAIMVSDESVIKSLNELKKDLVPMAKQEVDKMIDYVSKAKSHPINELIEDKSLFDLKEDLKYYNKKLKQLEKAKLIPVRFIALIKNKEILEKHYIKNPESSHEFYKYFITKIIQNPKEYLETEIILDTEYFEKEDYEKLEFCNLERGNA